MSCFTIIWKQGKFFILVAISFTSFIVLSMQSTFLSLPNLHQAKSLPWGGGLPYLAYKHICATLQLRYGFQGLEF